MADQQLNHNQAKLLDSYNNQLKADMPEECILPYKKLLFCQIKAQDYIKKNYTPGQLFYHNYRYGDRVKGCEQEYSSFNQCYGPFLDKYNDLKNYVAVIENKPQNIVPGDDEIFHSNLKEHSLKISPYEVLQIKPFYNIK